MTELKFEEVLKKALTMEGKGHKFYVQKAQQSENAITMKTFAFLANEEVLHIENIEKFYDAQKQKNQFPAVDFKALKNKRAKGLDEFSRYISGLKEKIKPADDDKKACEIAMQFETEGYNYYNTMRGQAEDTGLASLLEFLMYEENRHYEIIMNLNTYLNDSGNWFMQEEGSFPQG